MKKRIFSLFLNLILFFTFNLASFPNLGTTAYAASNCDDVGEGQDQGYIYKAGCEFDESKTQVTSWNPKTVNKILTGVIAASAIASAFYVIDPQSKLDCPGNISASITLGALLAGSIAYIAGELQANIRFKKAAKKATDLTFEVKEEDKEKSSEELSLAQQNKQVEAFKNLLSIYEDQVGVIRTKTTLTSVALGGFVAATGVEVANLIACKASCKTEGATLKATINTLLGTIDANVAGGCAAGTAFTNFVRGKNGVASGVRATEKVTEEGLSINKIAKMGFFTAMGPAAPLVSLGGLVKQGKRKINGVKNDGISKATLASLNGFVAAISTESAGYAAGVYTAERVPFCAIQIATAESVIGSLAAPYFCCGVDTVTAPTFMQNPNLTDILAVAEDLLPGMGNVAFLNNEEKNSLKQNLMMLVYNSFMEDITEKISHSDHSPLKKLELMSSYARDAEKALDYVDKNFDSFFSTGNEKIYNQLAIEIQNKNFNNISKILETVGNNFLLANAYADDSGGGFMKVLGWAGQILALYMAVNMIYKNIARTTPKSRIAYFGILSVIAGVTLALDAKALKDKKEQVEVIKEQIKNFLAASGTNSGLKQGAGNSELDLVQFDPTAGDPGAGNYPGCMAPTGNSYGPVKCPSLIPMDKIKIPSLTKRTASLLPASYGTALGTLSDVAFNAAKGAYASGSGLLDAEVNKMMGASNAMRAHNEKLIKKYDEMNAKEPELKDKDGKVIKPMSLADMNKQFLDSFNKNNGGIILPPATLAVDEKAKDQKSSDENKVAAVKAPEFQTGKDQANPTGLDLDLGLDDLIDDNSVAEATNEEQQLEDFVINQNDISDKKETSLFKILSNRYIQSYSKILEKKE